MKAKEAGMSTVLCEGMTEERISLLNEVDFVWSVQRQWSHRYEELKAYKEENGNCLIPCKYAVNQKLANWVTNQRQGYRRHMNAKKAGKPTAACEGMTEEKISLLNGVGFCWTASAAPEKWDYRYKELKAYKEENGDCVVPQKYAANKRLGRWVAKQRRGYQQYMKAKEAGELATTACQGMTEERIDLLDTIGFCWSIRRSRKLKRAS